MLPVGYDIRFGARFENSVRNLALPTSVHLLKTYVFARTYLLVLSLPSIMNNLIVGALTRLPISPRIYNGRGYCWKLLDAT